MTNSPNYGEPPSSGRGEYAEDPAVKDPTMLLLGAVGWEEQSDLLRVGLWNLI